MESHHNPISAQVETALRNPPIKWCGISLDLPFRCPTSREELAYPETKGIFKNQRHTKRYNKLLKAFSKEMYRLRQQQKNDFKAEKARCKVEQDAEAEEFHAEFLGRLSWGESGCVLSLDPDGLKEYAERLQGDKIDSKFPTINKYFGRFPALSIAWAVDDFYKWQKVRYNEAENLLKVKHLWDWYEMCYTFLHAVYHIRLDCDCGLPSWLANLRDVVRNSEDRERSARMIGRPRSEWSPETDIERKMLQFNTVKQIWKICGSANIPFPLDFCPRGTTPMEFFKVVARPRTRDDFLNPKILFSRSHNIRFPRHTPEGSQIESQIEKMLNCDTPHDYYERYPQLLCGRSLWDCQSIRDDVSESEVLLRNLSGSEISSLYDDENHVDDHDCYSTHYEPAGYSDSTSESSSGVDPTFPGAYPTSGDNPAVLVQVRLSIQ